jgi:hypothetical protein
MIVMLSVLREHPVFAAMITPVTPRATSSCGARYSCDVAGKQPATPAGWAHHDISPVDNAVPGVDDLTAKSFFLTHPVDGINPW